MSHAYAIPKDGQLGQEYFDRCIPVVEQRLAMAGVRLATLLNRIFEGYAGTLPAVDHNQDAGAAPDFVGSRNSEVYHHPTCPVVRRIKPDNLVKYASAPKGKRLHKGCRP